jgi:hypothetical protein
VEPPSGRAPAKRGRSWHGEVVSIEVGREPVEVTGGLDGGDDPAVSPVLAAIIALSDLGSGGNFAGI